MRSPKTSVGSVVAILKWEFFLSEFAEPTDVYNVNIQLAKEKPFCSLVCIVKQNGSWSVETLCMLLVSLLEAKKLKYGEKYYLDKY